MRGHICIAAAIVGCLLLGCDSAAAAALACDAHKADNDAARALRLKADFAGATRIVDQILTRDPRDFRANYTVGLILIDQSGIERPGKADLPTAQRGIAQLILAAGLLKEVDGACVAANGWYGIFNTIGAEYGNIGNLADAERYWKLAYDRRQALNASTRQKLLNNLGRLYLKEQKLDLAARYYREGIKADAPGAAANLESVTELNALLKPRNM